MDLVSDNVKNMILDAYFSSTTAPVAPMVWHASPGEQITVTPKKKRVPCLYCNGLAFIKVDDEPTECMSCGAPVEPEE